MGVHSYNPSIWEAEVGRADVQGHPQLYGEFKSSLSYMRLGHKQANKQTKPNRAMGWLSGQNR